MTMEATEQGTSKLEVILGDAPSEETPEVSETTGENEPKAEVETEDTAKEPEKPEDKPDPKFEDRVKAEADKRSKSYQEKREADKAYIDKLKSERDEARKQATAKKMGGLLSQLEADGETEGLTEKQMKPLREALKEFAENYDNVFTPVKETADFITEATKNLPAHVIKNNGLDDPNPAVRAKNGMKFIDGTIDGYVYNQNFLMALEFLPNGEEIRKQLEGIVEELGSPDYPTEKAKRQFLEAKMKGLKVTPKKKPPTPSGNPGSVDYTKLDGRQLMEIGFRNEK